MAKGNALGNFIRNRRKEINIPGGVSGLARRLGCSVGYMSRVELGSADGPSLKFLQEVSQELGVDLRHLVQLKEQDNADERATQATESSRENELVDTRASLTARHAMTLLTGHHKERHHHGAHVDTDLSGIQGDLETLGIIHLSVTDKLRSKVPLAGSLSEILNAILAEILSALKCFERIGSWGLIALCCLKAGRVYRDMAYDQSASFEERLNFLLEAGDWFERGYDIYTKHFGALSDEQRGRRPECLAQWARTDELIAQRLDRLSQEQVGEFDLAEVQDNVNKALQAFYLERVRAKREEALTQYATWIDRLLLMGEDENGAWEKKQLLLAETYHRLGIMYRDLADGERPADNEEGIRRLKEYSLHGIDAFLNALKRRRALVAVYPQDQKQIEKYLSSLANTHGEFGLSLQLRREDQGVDRAVMRAEAYWQFKVAAKLYSVLEMDAETPCVEYITGHILGIQTEEGKQSDIITRRRVENLLAESDFGTKERPAFGYPMKYCLGNGEAPVPGIGGV